MAKARPETFEEASSRIAEIAEAVSGAEVPLASLLELFDEAAELGVAASDLMSRDIAVPAEGEPRASQAGDGSQVEERIA